ncbi:MAG: hypothetical protein Q7O66_17800 [Dehalococcoidia bacterium]|nr:hypothetical protein [Dehalococcoidia bacterium]
MFAGYHSKAVLRNLRVPRRCESIEKVSQADGPLEPKRLAQEAAQLAKNECSAVAAVDTDTVYFFGPKVGELTPINGLMGLGPFLKYDSCKVKGS